MPTQVDASAAAGSLIAGKYRIEELLGRGGMGAVYAARHVRTGRRFAIKLLSRELTGDEGAEERFVREALLANSIQHPAIVEVYDVGRDRGVPYMVMKLLQGETLGARLERGPLSVEQTLTLMLPVIDAIGAAHALGIVHRDLKPDNVLIEREGGREFPRVLDFGIGKLLAGDARGPAITRPGTIIGTPEYMAPEQVRGDAELDARCDVYALGVMLFELLTGSLPHTASDLGTLLRAIAYGAPPSPRALRPDLPEHLDAVITRALSPHPANRYPTATALAQALHGDGPAILQSGLGGRVSGGRRSSTPAHDSGPRSLGFGPESASEPPNADCKIAGPSPWRLVPWRLVVGGVVLALVIGAAVRGGQGAVRVRGAGPQLNRAVAVVVPEVRSVPDASADASAAVPVATTTEVVAPAVRRVRAGGRRPPDAGRPAGRRSAGMPSLSSEILDPFQ